MSKTEVSGKQLKDGSVELVDLAPEVSGALSTLQSDVATLQTDVAAKADAGTLASVATSGSYTDLADKPTIPSVVGLASETYVDTAVAGVVNSAPAVLDTLNELAAALGNDENFATTVAGQIGDVTSDVSALDTRVTAVEADVASLQGANVPNLSDLGEVAITTPSSGQVLKYDGLGWVNAADSTFSGAYTDLTDKPTLFDGAYSSLTGAPTLATVATSGSYADLSNKPSIPSAIDDLSDVTISSPSSDQVLKYNGTAWVNSAAPASGATDLDGLSDVVITSPASTHHLRYNGTNWVNAVIPATDLPVAQQSAGILDTGFQIINGEKRFASTMQVNAMASFGTAISISGGQSGTFAGGKIVCGGEATTGYMDFYTKVNGQQFQELKRANISDGGLFSMYYGASIASGAAATKGLIVKGAASQTGDLFELQNSAGTWLTRLTSTGLLRFNYAASTTPIMVSNQWNEVMFQVAIGANSATSNSTIRLGTQVYQYSEFGWNGTNSCFHIWGRNNRVFSMQSPDEGAGVYTFDIARNTGTGAWEIGSGNRSFNMKTSTTGGVGINTAPGAAFHTLSTLASRKGIIVQGAVSQTANLFEAQDSSNTALFAIGSAGDVSLGASMVTSRAGSSYAMIVRESDTHVLMMIQPNGFIHTGTRASSPYNATTANSANMYVHVDGGLYRSTSSLKYKTDVQNLTHGLDKVLELRAVTYKGKGTTDSNTRYGGLVAEEVHDAGLTEFVQYAEDGSPDALAYGNMVSLAFKAIQELNAKVDALQAEKESLKARINVLENS